VGEGSRGESFCTTVHPSERNCCSCILILPLIDRTGRARNPGESSVTGHQRDLSSDAAQNIATSTNNSSFMIHYLAGSLVNKCHWVHRAFATPCALEYRYESVRTNTQGRYRSSASTCTTLPHNSTSSCPLPFTRGSPSVDGRAVASIYLLTLRAADPRCACRQGCKSGGQSQLMVAAAVAAGRVRRTLMSTGCTGHGCTWQPHTMVWGPPARDLRPPPPRLARWSTCNWHGCTGQPQRAAAAPRRPAPCTRLHTRSIQRPACYWQSVVPHHRRRHAATAHARPASILSARPRSRSASPSSLRQRGMKPLWPDRRAIGDAHWSVPPRPAYPDVAFLVGGAWVRRQIRAFTRSGGSRLTFPSARHAIVRRYAEIEMF